MNPIELRAWSEDRGAMAYSEVEGWEAWGDCYMDSPAEKITQFTGVKDKNGTKIFEGDIVETPQHKYCRRWIVSDNHCGAFVLFNGLNSEMYLCDDKAIGWDLVNNCNEIDMVVIGNIYENPDLLPTT